MRIVGASCRVCLTQPVMTIAGFGNCARLYGVEDMTKHAVISKRSIMTANYQGSVNFSNPSDSGELRGVYAPADFSDLHFKNPHVDYNVTDQIRKYHFPVVHGLVEGLSD